MPRDQFDAARYEGSDGDERRLFYVALTRARDWLSVSRHGRVNKPRGRRLAPTTGNLPTWRSSPRTSPCRLSRPTTSSDGDPISITYSELAAFIECGLAFRLRNLIGFQPRLAPELGYGKAVHHVMRAVAEATKASGHVPTAAEIDELLDSSFFLPDAPTSRPTGSSRTPPGGSSTTYTAKYEADLHRVWETERPFELHLDGVTVTGRADVILDQEGGVPTALAIVDYKTATHGRDQRPRPSAPGLRRRRPPGRTRRSGRLRPRPEGGVARPGRRRTRGDHAEPRRRSPRRPRASAPVTTALTPG